jgi:Ca2+-binding RTX toxin-like protein
VAGLLLRWVFLLFDFSARHSTMRALGCALHLQIRRNDMAVITGDANDNVLRALSSSDTVYGLDGNDTIYGPGQMYGGFGDDTYIISVGGPYGNLKRDQGQELIDQGYDTLIFNLKHDYVTTLIADSPNIEEYIVNGNPIWVNGGSFTTNIQNKTIALNATKPAMDTDTGSYVDSNGNPYPYQIYGGNGDDTIWGSNYADIIDGGIGADVLLGGKGDDIYEVNVKSDIVIEMGGGGHDRIDCTAREYNLQINVEDLYAYGERGATGKYFNGNVGNNHIEITGDFNRDVLAWKGNDYVSTAGGNDWLRGGEGNDTLVGGLGNDYYRNEGTNFGADVINDAGGGDDTLEFLSVDAERLWFVQDGMDLKITSIDSNSNSVRIQNWFATQDRPIENIFAHGKELNGQKVDNLLSVMSNFVMPGQLQPMDASVTHAIQSEWI